jgi:hypothetical protein
MLSFNEQSAAAAPTPAVPHILPTSDQACQTRTSADELLVNQT